MAETRIIVGLGNPGRQYRLTRHNTGFKVIDLLAKSLDVEVSRRKFGARFAEAEFAGKKLILVKPWQYMNCSGQVVATAVGFYRLGVGELLVVTDDIYLKPGSIRLRAKGSAGGHNGLADIIDKLGTDEFARCRVGVGSPEAGQDAVDYVLGSPTRAQGLLLDEACLRAREVLLCWIEHGIDVAMNAFSADVAESAAEGDRADAQN